MSVGKRRAQKGSALVYILIAVALLGALTATFMDSSGQQTTSQNTFNTVTELNSQINLIRSGIDECVLNYPSGDNALVMTAYNIPYPINSDSSYLLNPVSTASGSLVSGLRCPGNPGNSNNHAVIFGGTSGKTLGPPPKLFNAWKYYSGVDGVFFYTSTNKTDSYLTTALNKLDDQYSECEADVINNSSGSAAMNITSHGATGPNCPAYSTCFRVWMIARPVNIYPGDTDGDEGPSYCP